MGEWFGRCMENEEDHLARVGDGVDTTSRSNVQYKHGNNRVEWNRNSHKEDIKETGPLLQGNRANRASGYNVRKYNTSTSATGTDISMAT